MVLQYSVKHGVVRSARTHSSGNVCFVDCGAGRARKVKTPVAVQRGSCSGEKTCRALISKKIRAYLPWEWRQLPAGSPHRPLFIQLSRLIAARRGSAEPSRPRILGLASALRSGRRPNLEASLASKGSDGGANRMRQSRSLTRTMRPRAKKYACHAAAPQIAQSGRSV